MSELSLENKNSRKRSWLLPLIIVVLVAVIAVTALALTTNIFGLSTGAATGENPIDAETPQALWDSQDINSYQYTLQVSCFCLVEATRPVTIEVIDGQVASMTYADDGTAADPALFERYDSVDKLFAIINDAESQDPVRLDVTYDETYGVPLSVNIDISEMIADEELYFTVSDFESLK
jgi:hypothetical protein